VTVDGGRRLAGTCHLVTGGSSGLGAAVVRRLLSRDARVVVLDLRPPPGSVPFVEVDLADGEAAAAATTAAVELLGGLDGVVAAAGIDACGTLGEVPAAAWNRVVAVNLLGVAAVVRTALPELRRSSGSVVTVASTLALRSLPAATAYCASKAGVLAFTRALAAEESGRVRVSCLTPGGMATSFFDGRPDEFRPAEDAVLNDPDAVAAAVMFVLTQPEGCEVRELVVTPSTEPSWP
jgi:NAD(P)-dependent dehydrogenase (short-subunit alcohol dehydrogenase family)